jgi:hypothetical protein
VKNPHPVVIREGSERNLTIRPALRGDKRRTDSLPLIGPAIPKLPVIDVIIVAPVGLSAIVRKKGTALTTAVQKFKHEVMHHRVRLGQPNLQAMHTILRPAQKLIRS